jgi:hypothetical protein
MPVPTIWTCILDHEANLSCQCRLSWPQLMPLRSISSQLVTELFSSCLIYVGTQKTLKSFSPVFFIIFGLVTKSTKIWPAVIRFTTLSLNWTKSTKGWLAETRLTKLRLYVTKLTKIWSNVTRLTKLVYNLPKNYHFGSDFRINCIQSVQVCTKPMSPRPSNFFLK